MQYQLTRRWLFTRINAKRENFSWEDIEYSDEIENGKFENRKERNNHFRIKHNYFPDFDDILWCQNFGGDDEIVIVDNFDVHEDFDKNFTLISNLNTTKLFHSPSLPLQCRTETQPTLQILSRK